MSTALDCLAPCTWGSSGACDVRLVVVTVLGFYLAVLAALPATASEVPGAADASSVAAWQEQEWTDLDGNRWSAEELLGKVVLLDFWATWCLPCLAQMPHLRELSQRFAERDVVVLGVVLDGKQRRPLRSFLARHDITWPQVHQPLAFGSDAARHFGIDTVPATVVVDRRGRIVARNLTGPALGATLQMLVDLDAP